MARRELLAAFAFAWIVGTGCAAAKPQSRHVAQSKICENQCFEGAVLLTTDNAESGFLKNYYFPIWNPSTNAVNEALSQVEGYLQNATNESRMYPAQGAELPVVQRQLSKTVCQAVGVTYAGRKGIFLNCLPAEDSWSEGWQDHFIKVFDGGPRYWSVVYLVDEQKFTHLEIDLGY